MFCAALELLVMLLLSTSDAGIFFHFIDGCRMLLEIWLLCCFEVTLAARIFCIFVDCFVMPTETWWLCSLVITLSAGIFTLWTNFLCVLGCDGGIALESHLLQGYFTFSWMHFLCFPRPMEVLLYCYICGMEISLHNESSWCGWNFGFGTWYLTFTYVDLKWSLRPDVFRAV